MPDNNEDLLAELSDKSKQNLQSIQEELTLLSVKWHIYCELFQNLNGANTLWEASELIYSIFIESLRDDLIITISRLTDSANTRKDENSTFLRLCNDLEEVLSKRDDNEKSECNSKLFNELKNKLYELDKCIKEIKILRNKRKAHRDLSTIIKQNEDRQNNQFVDNNFDLDVNKSIEIMQEILSIFFSIFGIYLVKGFKLNTGNKDVGYFIKNLEEGNKWRKDDIERILNQLKVP
ncbi:MAG: hypothetical protein Q8Q54_12025 [Methylococcales bacterium]|nr:hypothetical protein [Methylococcales bacterium]MDP3333993.1 hypothetical protein [Methylococcaceae bacterium]MDP3839637.1 hypothetical protein [Methylococcales bacterium]